MKKLQNNFTTPEQSKWLLKLGVPADSADMFYYTAVAEYPRIRAHAYGHISNEHSIPCWSVGRLIEICLKCSILEQRQVRFICDGDDDEYSLIDYVITVLESGIMTNHMDFSKLED